MASPSLDKLERQFEQAKARLQAARARKATKDRKLDARRKIILGGALIERAGRDAEVGKLLASLVRGLGRVQDRKAFEDWAPLAQAQGRAPPDAVLHQDGSAKTDQRGPVGDHKATTGSGDVP